MNETPDRIRILERLHDLGIHLIPCEPGADLGRGLENRDKIAREDLESQFSGNTNAAAAWGSKSGGLANVALRVEEARRVDASLPETGLAFGPETALETNRVYLLEEKIKDPVVFRDTTIASSPVLAEIRGDDTFDLVPPSKTPDGKDIKFLKFEGPVGAQWELRLALARTDQSVVHYDASVRAHVDRRFPRVTALLGCFSKQ